MRFTELNIENITDEIIEKVLFNTPKENFEEADCLIIFGCHLKELLDERLECAVNIIKKKKVDKILLTGGVGVHGDFNEAKYMKEFLLNNGIAEEIILVENKSTTTEENIINSIELLKENDLVENKKIVLVSSQAHLRRIGMEMKKQLKDYNVKIIYEYPEESIISFDKIKNNVELRMMLTNEVKKLVSFIGREIIDDEEIDFKLVKNNNV